MLNFNLPIKPLSVNSAFQGRRFKTKEYDKFISNCLLLMPNKKLKLSDMLRVKLTFGFSNKNADIDNPIKMVLDSITKKYGIDDRYIYGLEVEKKIVTKGDEFIDVTIEDYLPFVA